MNLFFRFSILLAFINLPGQAQFTDHHDSILWIRSIRFGCDISRFVLTAFTPGQNGFEVSSDIRLTPTFYPTIELGTEQVRFKDSLIKQTSSGQYMRIGFDINMRNYVKDFSPNMIFFGLRYGISNVNYQINHYTIYDTIWGNYSGSIGNMNAKAQWIEAAAGVRVEVFKNIFLGWSLRGRILLTPRNSPYPYIIPGYGSGENTTNVGINYSIYYQIPFMKMKTKYKSKKKTPPETPKKSAPKTSSP